MAIVSSAEQTHGDYSSPALQAGDVVVVTAITFNRLAESRATEQGWEVLGQWGESGFDLFVAWKRATSAGTLTLDITPDTRWLASVVVRGFNAVAAWEVARQNAQVFSHPGAFLDDTPQSGDIVYSAIYDPYRSGSFSPAGATVRQSQLVREGSGRKYGIVSTDSFSGQTELDRVSGTGFGGGWAVTVALANVAGPDAPTILTPTGSSLNLAAGVDVAWEPSTIQTGYAVRARVNNGAWSWWDGDGFDASTEQIVSGAATSIAVPAGDLSNGGDVWDIEVATKGDMERPELGAYARVSVTGWGDPTAPTVAVTDVTGGVLDSFTPTISMSGTVAAGATGPRYRIQILDADGGVLLDTGVLSWDFYTLSVEQGAILSRHNREDITVVAWTVQNADHHSDPTATMLHLDVVTPAAPTVSVAPHHHAVSGLPGTLITSTSTETTGTLEVARVTDGRRDLIWAGDVTASGWLVTDYLAPVGTSVHYEARVTTDDTIPLTSPWGQSALTYLADHDVCGWLVDPLDPATAVHTGVMDLGPDGADLRTTAVVPLGQSGWVVHSGVATADAGRVALEVEGDAASASLHALLVSGRRLLLRGWTEVGVRDKSKTGIGADIWLRPTGSIERSRPVAGPWSLREYQVTFVSVDPPTYPSA